VDRTFSGPDVLRSDDFSETLDQFLFIHHDFLFGFSVINRLLPKSISCFDRLSTNGKSQ